jgi:hypothetical protein
MKCVDGWCDPLHFGTLEVERALPLELAFNSPLSLPFIVSKWISTWMSTRPENSGWARQVETDRLRPSMLAPTRGLLIKQQMR